MKIIIEDQVVPQLLTAAIEAYEIGHRTAHSRRSPDTKIETYGLLWGYVIPERNNHPARAVATMATVETSALRTQDFVQPDLNSITLKKEFINKYWPHLELVGTFHSHPYNDLEEVHDLKGWRASAGDKDHWPWIHEELNSALPQMAHLIVTITELQKKGWGIPSRLPGSEGQSGYVLSADNRKIWIKGYATEETQEGVFELNQNVELDIPTLERRFL